MSHEEIEHYGDPHIASKDAKVPTWLLAIYVVAFLWGVIGCYLYIGGADGWIDRGYWFQLEKAANTTYPWHDADRPGHSK